MSATCRRCQRTYDGLPYAPCPDCGTPSEASLRPGPQLASEPLPDRRRDEYAQPNGYALEQLPPSGYAPARPSSLPHPQPHPQQPTTSPSPPQGIYPAPPQIQVVVQNHINVPLPYPLPYPAYPPSYPQAYPQPYAPPYPQSYPQSHPQSYAQPYAQPYPMAYVPAAYYPIAPYVRRKDPGVSTLLSFFVPGAGQLYNGQIGKGCAFLAASLINFLLLFIGVGFFTGLITWIWGMVDAHGTAEKINRGQIVV